MSALQLLVLSLWAAVASGFVQVAPPVTEHVIDLVALKAAEGPTDTTAAVPQHRRWNDHPQGMASHNAPRPAPPVILEAPLLDRSGYVIGDEFFFEVVVKNTGTKPMPFPTSLDGARVDREAPGAMMATIVLTFSDELWGRQLVGNQTLYGAEGLAGSLLVVRPGEQIRVRAKSQWFLTSGARKAVPDRWIRDLELHSTLMLSGPGKQSFITSSAATVLVQLRN